MNKEELLRYGNELTICGFIVGNANEREMILFPDEGKGSDNQKASYPNDEEIQAIIKQMDIQEIEGLQKVILRKSQRQIDQRVSWEVFRRDNFTCVYCGTDNVPMTVDHIILWEYMGDSVPDNLNCSCKKCNKTRGSMDYDEWMSILIGNGNDLDHLSMLVNRGKIAKAIPLRKTKRSR